MSAIARFVIRHPRKIISFWVVVLLLSGMGASRLSDRVQNGGYAASGSQSIRAGELGTILATVGAVVHRDRELLVVR